MLASDHYFMRRALDLALLGQGKTSPNPMVGCVIVYQGQIIGEGWHQQYGGPHAEVNAINSVKNKALLPDSRLYVTLEPCSHFGKTPPCADLLITHQIKDVVICNSDPNPLVKGAGIRKLLEADCKVHVGLLEKEGLELNKYFFTYHTQKRPYILLKWAQTANGFIGRADQEKLWISNALSKKLVHKYRTEVQAIMVGTQTALVDNPQLNSREWSGKNPLRIVLDLQNRLPENLHVFDKSQPTLVYNNDRAETLENLEWVKIDKPVDVIPAILEDLHRRNIQSVLVEGGTTLLNSFIKADLWDEAIIFQSDKNLETAGIAAPTLPLPNLNYSTTLATDKLLVYKN